MSPRQPQETGLVTHNIAPVYNEHSRILILGSMPGPVSRKAEFYYSNKQNIFWQLLAGLLGQDEPAPTVEARRSFALAQGVALWDVLAQAQIKGAADSSIKQARANDIRPILQAAQIGAIFTTGQAAHRLYAKHIEPQTGRQSIYLPSTSPANRAAQKQPQFLASWQQILVYL